MSAELKIQRLSVVDAAAFVALRRMALETEPLALGASADDDVGLVLERVVQHGQIAVGRQGGGRHQEDDDVDLDPRGHDHG